MSIDLSLHHKPTALLMPPNSFSERNIGKTQLFFSSVTDGFRSQESPVLPEDGIWGIAISPITMQIRMAIEYVTLPETSMRWARHCSLAVLSQLIEKLSIHPEMAQVWGHYVAHYTTRFAHMHDIPIQWDNRDEPEMRIKKSKAFSLLSLLGITNFIAISTEIESGDLCPLRQELEWRRLVPPTELSKKNMYSAQIKLLEAAFPQKDFNYIF